MGSPHHVFWFWVYLIVAQATIHGIHAQGYAVNNEAKESPGGRRFESEIKEAFVKQQMFSATLFIHKSFDQIPPFNTKFVKSISLNILEHHSDSDNFVVSKTEVQVSAKYFEENYKDNIDELKKDFTRRLYHATTNIWQWTANGNIPSTLKEGIADFIVLKSGHAPDNWKPGDGESWDESSAVTALFLEYCESHHHNFVAELNKKLKTAYAEHYFEDLLGMPLADMWKKYKSKYS